MLHHHPTLRRIPLNRKRYIGDLNEAEIHILSRAFGNPERFYGDAVSHFSLSTSNQPTFYNKPSLRLDIHDLRALMSIETKLRIDQWREHAERNRKFMHVLSRGLVE